MTLMASRKQKNYRWNAGDFITADEAAELLGYKSSKRLRDKNRRLGLLKEFDELDCTLTLGIVIGGQQRFLRSEIDEFLSAKIEAAKAVAEAEEKAQRRRNLKLAA